MIDHEREKSEALREDQPKIDQRHYGRYSDVVGRMGVEWFEKMVEDWEGDHLVYKQGKRQ